MKDIYMRLILRIRFQHLRGLRVVGFLVLIAIPEIMVLSFKGALKGWNNNESSLGYLSSDSTPFAKKDLNMELRSPCPSCCTCWFTVNPVKKLSTRLFHFSPLITGLLSLRTILPKSNIAQTREGGCHLRSAETITLRDGQGFKDNLFWDWQI